MSLTLLKKALKESSLSYGEKDVLSRLKNGTVKKIFIAKGCRNADSIKRYASLATIEVVELEENSIELGVACKKPFSIGVLCY